MHCLTLANLQNSETSPLNLLRHKIHPEMIVHPDGHQFSIARRSHLRTLVWGKSSNKWSSISVICVMNLLCRNEEK